MIVDGCSTYVPRTEDPQSRNKRLCILMAVDRPNRQSGEAEFGSRTNSPESSPRLDIYGGLAVTARPGLVGRSDGEFPPDPSPVRSGKGLQRLEVAACPSLDRFMRLAAEFLGRPSI
jgi:hypothetical protein